MIQSRVKCGRLFTKTVRILQKRHELRYHNRSKIGNREWVAYGPNGRAEYFDLPDHPFPAIRYREFTNELIALREKEKGDWRKLSCEEKKCLYRASFALTYAEFLADDGSWKSVLGYTLICLSIAIWLFLAMRIGVDRETPLSLSEERRRAQLRRKLILRVNPITGVSSKWDYEADDWKKNVKKNN